MKLFESSILFLELLLMASFHLLILLQELQFADSQLNMERTSNITSSY